MELRQRLKIGLVRPSEAIWHRRFSEVVQRYSQEDLLAMAESIKMFGLLHPVTVRPHPKNPGSRYFEILDGGLRYWAMRDLLKRKTIMAWIHRNLSDDDAEILALNLNVNVKPLEEYERERS